MNVSGEKKRSGFTLVELLVVIVIIAALAALSFTVLPRMMRKAKASEALSNLRQIAPLLTTYATDHSMMLPAAENNEVIVDGVASRLQWTGVCLNLLFPDVAVTEFDRKAWWDQNKPFLKNPLFKGWTPTNPGYALNEMIAENADAARETPSGTELLNFSVPLAAISEPARTPWIAPSEITRYRLDSAGDANTFRTGGRQNLLVDGKLSVLFVDGHVETLTPTEYVTRKLYEFPRQ